MRTYALASLATAATATRVLSGGGLPSLKPRVTGRQAVLPAVDKTMVRFGDEVKALLENEREYTDALAAMRAGGAPPEDFPSEYDWPEPPNNIEEYSMSEEWALPYFTARVGTGGAKYKAPEQPGVDTVHDALDQTLRDRRKRYRAARRREAATYILLADLVERAAAQAPGANVSERTQRHVAGVERAQLNAEQKAYAKKCGFCECVPTEVQTDPEWAEFQAQALKTPLNPPTFATARRKMSSCQCELG